VGINRVYLIASPDVASLIGMLDLTTKTSFGPNRHKKIPVRRQGKTAVSLWECSVEPEVALFW